MDPITVSVSIAKPREEVFAYLADIANHAEFTDHFLVDWRLTREETVGRGAGARFRMKMPLNRFPWGDANFTEVEAPRRIVERGRAGKYNRIRTLGIYEVDPGPSGTTRVTFTFETLPKTPSDKLLEKLGARTWMKRKLSKSMRRLREVLEEDRGRGARPTIAGGPRKPASQFRFEPSARADG
ncbi:SRPBCC family protein [Conexibacter sp. SYSU D00693]|uniref:SRPBCC family protein n=1 Tax=Conexibacter sp. SYSU D00693 TaxID=2812560 RepID=UPI00196BA5F7|nr:SRPBCC family protein [Conexibacter sp. SYSU D00693]